ncbi:MAG: TadE/TadG family type IV pilus assembly protein, partial [Terracidiphilus sp.]
MKRVNNLRGRAMALLCGLNRAAASSRTRVESWSLGGWLRSGDKGQSLVEFAVVLPLLLLIITFMFSLTMAMVSYEMLGDATASVAQLQLAPGRALLADPCATVATGITAALPSWTPSNFTYTVTITNSSGTAYIY